VSTGALPCYLQHRNTADHCAGVRLERIPCSRLSSFKAYTESCFRTPVLMLCACGRSPLCRCAAGTHAPQQAQQLCRPAATQFCSRHVPVLAQMCHCFLCRCAAGAHALQQAQQRSNLQADDSYLLALAAAADGSLAMQPAAADSSNAAAEPGTPLSNLAAALASTPRR
jgi:hypothetical protein